MATATKSKASKAGKATDTNGKRIIGEWYVKLQGEIVDYVGVQFNPKGGPDSGEFRYTIYCDGDGGGIDDRDEVRQSVADMIRQIRADAIDARNDRDNDQLDEAIDALKDAGKARKALEILRAAGLID